MAALREAVLRSAREHEEKASRERRERLEQELREKRQREEEEELERAGREAEARERLLEQELARVQRQMEEEKGRIEQEAFEREQAELLKRISEEQERLDSLEKEQQERETRIRMEEESSRNQADHMNQVPTSAHVDSDQEDLVDKPQDGTRCFQTESPSVKQTLELDLAGVDQHVLPVSLRSRCMLPLHMVSSFIPAGASYAEALAGLKLKSATSSEGSEEVTLEPGTEADRKHARAFSRGTSVTLPGYLSPLKHFRSWRLRYAEVQLCNARSN